MRQYPLQDIHDSDFEQLATLICSKILGEAVIGFASGPDGGRDGRFNGKANSFPSKSEPWKGKIVIQAKHTQKINASCSDSDFRKILKNDVLPAIKKLKEDKNVDCYLLFTNRKLTGKQDKKIEDLIDAETGIPNVVIANEKIQQWLKMYPDIVKASNLQSLLLPLQFDEEDLKALIAEFSKTMKSDKVEPRQENLTYLPLDRKNELNQLSKEYFEGMVKRHFAYFKSISEFLKNPINLKLKDRYEDAVDELNAKIIINRSDYSAFENLLDDLYNYVINNSIGLTGKKRLVRVFLHYMYHNCDIGKKND